MCAIKHEKKTIVINAAKVICKNLKFMSVHVVDFFTGLTEHFIYTPFSLPLLHIIKWISDHLFCDHKLRSMNLLHSHKNRSCV